MIYSIVAYGDTVLKKKSVEIDQKNTEINLPKLVEDMYETMYEANGVGLAAPQIGMGIRLFVIDSTRMEEEESWGIKRVFINPTILEQTGEKWVFEEGCLSIPNVRENVYRQPKIKIHYFDENWKEYTDEFDKMTARVIQHEYDHIEGVLFTDHLSSFKKTLLKSKLNGISRGNVKVEYRMRFPDSK